ncbi:hypothetical protein [Streptomyces synnematoformans]|uniref:Uncharacterized protein n=1 Tax=Streptomyces synnematoformans TaxID=415721 RepID=A0ABP5J8E4_9ACTN
MTIGLRLAWRLDGHGWADCTVTDRQAVIVLTASYVTGAPEEFLTALARLIAGETETRAQFEAEPTAYRWIFSRENEYVWTRVLELRDGRDHDNKGTEVWLSRYPIDELARAAIRCFDDVARTYGESSYRGKWGRHHFPRTDLEALRRLWNDRRHPQGALPDPHQTCEGDR